MQRRGFFAALGGVLAGLGIGRTAVGARAAEMTEDDWIVELNRQVTALYQAVGGEKRSAQEQEDMTRAAYRNTPKGLEANTFALVVPPMQQVVGRFPMLYDYWRWLSTPTYRTSEYTVIASVHPLSFTPDRLRDPDLQRAFVRWRIFNQT